MHLALSNLEQRRAAVHLAMDALAAGLIVMILGSYYLWWRLRQKRRFGVIALGAGLISCGWIVSGLF